jgi:hypothetical protein
MPRHRGVKGGANFTSATIVEAGSTQGVYRIKPDNQPIVTVNLTSTLWDLERKCLPTFQGVELFTEPSNNTGGGRGGGGGGGGGSAARGGDDATVELLTTSDASSLKAEDRINSSSRPGREHLTDAVRFHYDPLEGGAAKVYSDHRENMFGESSR